MRDRYYHHRRYQAPEQAFDRETLEATLTQLSPEDKACIESLANKISLIGSQIGRGMGLEILACIGCLLERECSPPCEK